MPILEQVFKIITDGIGDPFNGRFRDDGAGDLAPEHHLVGDDGVPLVGTTVDAAWDGAAAGPSWTAIWKAIFLALPSGSTGLDFSANKPALPNIGVNFGGSGPYASYALIATIPASPTRSSIDIENTSGAQIAVLRDDGTAAGGAAPVNASVFALAGGGTAGAQGASWNSSTFKGRIQVFAPSAGAQVAIFTD